MKRMVLVVLFFILVGVTASTAYSESPIITPFQWSTGLLENGTSKSTTFTVQNGGAADLVIRNIRLKTTSSSFSFAPATPLPATLPPGEEIQVVVTFTSAGEGVHRASIEVDYTESSP